MKSHVLTPLHHIRRVLDTTLASLLPPPTPAQTRLALSSSASSPFPHGRVTRWTSLYHMVTFRPDVGYAEALRREEWQKRVVRRTVIGAAGMLTAGLGWAGWAAFVLGSRKGWRRDWWKFW